MDDPTSHTCSFSDGLLYSLIWLDISSLSPHCLDLLFSCLRSILLLYNFALRNYFVLLELKIQFLSLSFPFVAILSPEQFPSSLNYPYGCFSSHFFFFLHFVIALFLLLLLLLVCIINLFLIFIFNIFFEFLYFCIYTILVAVESTLSFLIM